MPSPSQPAPDSLTPAESLFAAHIARLDAGEASDLEALCRAHPLEAAALRRLASDWDRHLPLAGLAQLRSGTHPDDEDLATPSLEERAAIERLLAGLSSNSGFVDRYVFQGEIGHGGMGVVYRVLDRKLERLLALKVIRGKQSSVPGAKSTPPTSRQLARFINEAKITSQLDHPGIVPVHESGADQDGRVYFTMKLVQGRTLAELLELHVIGNEQWTLERMLSILQRVCEAVSFAHERGVIHRDLKPTNVMVGDFGEVYVMDWGLARRMNEGAEPASVAAQVAIDEELARELTLTQDGERVGTPAYMSPEQARGEIGEMGPASDVYALGAMLYELISGGRPYRGEGPPASATETLDRVLAGPPEPLASEGTPAELIAICEKAMQRERSRRYPSMRELTDDLERFLAGRTVKAFETGGWAEAKKWMRRNRPLAVSLATVVVVLVVGVMTSLRYATAESEAKDEAKRLTVEAQNRERLATARENAVRAIEEFRQFGLCDGTLEQALELVDGRSADPAHGIPRKPGLADHLKLLAEIRSSGKQVNAGDHVTWEFGADIEKQWWNNQLEQLCDGLRGLRQRIDTTTHIANSVYVPNSVELEQLWHDAISSIATSPRYKGTTIKRHPELRPLGPDSKSGLWEFSDVLTGSVAQRGPDGTLAKTPEMGLVFVLLPGGRVPVEKGKEPGPLNARDLDPFYLSKYEVTEAQALRLGDAQPGLLLQKMGDWGAYSLKELLSTPKNACSSMYPADLSWDDWQILLKGASMRLQLPTEAQWEYGCRAGTTTPWWTGETEDTLRGAENVDWDGINGIQYDVLPVGTLRANPFGLFDTQGNKPELCRDAFGNYLPPQGGDMVRNESGAPDRVLRGGAHYSKPDMSSSDRWSVLPDGLNGSTGAARPVLRITP